MAAVSPSTATRSRSATRCSRCARGGTARRPARASNASSTTQARLRRDRWIWVYHAPPEGPLSWNGKRHYGDAVLADLIARHAPTAVLCGHIHEAPFKSGGSWVDRVGRTWVFNAGRQIGDVPARIEIDFGGLTARWISLAGIEERLLQ